MLPPLGNLWILPVLLTKYLLSIFVFGQNCKLCLSFWWYCSSLNPRSISDYTKSIHRCISFPTMPSFWASDEICQNFFVAAHMLLGPQIATSSDFWCFLVTLSKFAQSQAKIFTMARYPPCHWRPMPSSEELHEKRPLEASSTFACHQNVLTYYIQEMRWSPVL